MMENNDMNVEDELTRMLQEEIAKIWEQTPVGYNKDNDAYHIGKGIMVGKETWDKYLAAKEIYDELTPMDYVLGALNTAYQEMKNETNDPSKSE